MTVAEYVIESYKAYYIAGVWTLDEFAETVEIPLRAEREGWGAGPASRAPIAPERVAELWQGRGVV